MFDFVDEVRAGREFDLILEHLAVQEDMSGSFPSPL
jgi:hypothetical protein